jgi:hypothetical protein
MNRSRWGTESFLRRVEAFHDYTMDDLERDVAAIRDARRQRLQVLSEADR